MDLIEWLQSWYQQRCDGYWEHLYGVMIDTLDNPGWHVKIDLIDTPYENLPEQKMSEDKGEGDWISCTINNGVFLGFGDTHKLNKIIKVFKNWIGE